MTQHTEKLKSKRINVKRVINKIYLDCEENGYWIMRIL